MTTAPQTNAVEIPSKWDVIPLHTSDRGTFKECRRRWFWSSPAQANLTRKQSVYGIYEPFWFGNGIHYSLEKYYDPFLREDPEVVFDTWYDLQVNGGIVKESELNQFKDRKPEFNEKKQVWTIRGIAEVVPVFDADRFEELHQIGIGMMRYYKGYAEREDDFTVISSEHEFSVPVIVPYTGKALYMEDTREMPEGWYDEDSPENVYGPLWKRKNNGVVVKQVHARGRMDLIVQGNKTGNYVIIDHKTTDWAIDDEYFRHTDLDEQCTTYAWAAEVEAKLYDLPYKKISGVVYQALRKSFPKPPTITTRGLPSLDKQKETTTARMFEQCIQDLGLEAMFQIDDKMQAYYTYLVEKGEKQFIQRRDVPRNATQKENAGLRIYMEALDMLDSPRIYPNPTKNWSCLNCSFRAPCVAVEAGYDYEGMLKDGYESNFDR